MTLNWNFWRVGGGYKLKKSSEGVWICSGTTAHSAGFQTSSSLTEPTPAYTQLRGNQGCWLQVFSIESKKY